MTEDIRASSISPTAVRRSMCVAEALALLPGAGGVRFAKAMEHGSLVVEIYAPRGVDPQQPHTRDELYVVVSGVGEFVNGDERHGFAPGDVLFVPAGIVHRSLAYLFSEAGIICHVYPFMQGLCNIR